MTKSRIILVLGMHRSGTSAISRSLKAVSVDLGDELIPGVEGDNDKGFWEDKDLTRFNDKLLNKLENAWFKLAPVDSIDFASDAFATERYEAVSLIRNKISGKPVFGFKDPRVSLLLPFWKAIFDDLSIDASYVIALRNPLEVVESLKKRNRFLPSHSLALWLKYTWASVVHTTGSTRLCVSYNELLADPAKQLSRIASCLDLPAPPPTSREFMDFVGEFLSADLRRHSIPDNEVWRASAVSPVLREFYFALKHWAESPADEDLTLSDLLQQQLDGYFLQTRPLTNLADHFRSKAIEAGLKAEGLEKSLAEQTDTLAHTRAHLDQAKSSLEYQANQILSAQSEADASLKQAAQLSSQLEISKTLVASMREQIEHFVQQAENARLDVAQAKDRAEQTRAQLDMATSFATELKEQLSLTRAQLQEKDHLLRRQETLAEETQGKLTVTLTRAVADAELRTKERSELVEKLLRLEEQLRRTTDQQQTERQRLVRLQNELSEKTTELRLRRHEVRAYQSSTSWRVTSPIRATGRILRRVARVFVRA